MRNNCRYNWLYEAYQSFPREIMRVDVARIAALHHYGGVYADSNVCVYCERRANALQRFTEMRKTCKIKLPKTSPFGVSNDLILAPPQHPFL